MYILEIEYMKKGQISIKVDTFRTSKDFFDKPKAEQESHCEHYVRYNHLGTYLTYRIREVEGVRDHDRNFSSDGR